MLQTPEINTFASTSRVDFLVDIGGDTVLQDAARSFSECRDAINSLIPRKIEFIPLYDPQNMDRIVNICHWGRSGSLLLASFLDNHDHILMLPVHLGEKIYAMLASYGHLSVWDRLLAYPSFAKSVKGIHGDFFVEDNPFGKLAIEPPHYYAAVCALAAMYRDSHEPWLQTRAGFIKCLHVAYAIALGRRPGTDRPMIVYAQHWPNDDLARRLVEDFPKAQFLHTVRDPLTAVGSWYDGNMDNYMYCYNENRNILPRYLDAATIAMVYLLTRDQGHPAMAHCTRAVRFEDLHLEPVQTMRRVAEWLNIPFSGRLLESTWNGHPYVVDIRGKPTCGSNPANAKRRTTHLSTLDQYICFAVFRKNFIVWGYESPRSLRNSWLRALLIGLALLKPLNIEFLNARAVFKLNFVPALKSGQYLLAAKIALNLPIRRARVAALFANVSVARALGRKKPMRLI